MSSSLQRSPASERGPWHSAFSPKSHLMSASQNQGNLQLGHATMTARHSAKDKQIMSHSFHLSADLQSRIDDRDASALSPSLHSAKDFESSSASDVSTASVTSLSKDDKLCVKESSLRKNAPQNTKTNFAHQKPPILSPKPNILPKAKAITQLSPNTVNGERKPWNSDAKQVSSNKFLFNDQTEIKDYRRGRSQSVEDEQAVGVKEILPTTFAAGHQLQKPVKRSQTLPRQVSHSKNVKNLEMESTRNKVNVEKLSFRSPPKVPVKPKLKSYSDSISHTKNPSVNGKLLSNELMSSSEAQDSSIASVSEVRSKFEEMKIKFRKPVPDPEFNPPQPSKPYSRVITPSSTAEELFKDILEMKTLDNFSPKEEKTFHHDSKISTGNKAATENFWSKPKKTHYNPADVPAPTLVQGDDLQHVDFMDLPPPPELPPCDVTNKEALKVDEKTSALRRNMAEQSITGFHQTDKQLIASGCANTRTNNAMSVRDLFDNNRKSDKNFQPVKAENPLSKKRPGETDHNAVLLQTSSASSWRSNAVKQKVATQFDDAKFPLPARSLDDEILYYDNMDIMEKVRQKREQDEKKMQKLTQEKKTVPNSYTRSKSSQKQDSKSTPTLIPASPNRVLSTTTSTPQQISNAPSFDDGVSFAAETLEKEYLKLKTNLDDVESQSAPPKLPPKQLKFNRRQAIETADKQPSPSSDKSSPILNEAVEASNSQPLRIHIGTSPTPLAPSPHISTPIPTQTSPQFLDQNPGHRHQSQIMTQQLTPEDARARQLVDEPLAPIIEEDSTYGDSSSCASSVVDDDSSFTGRNSVHVSDVFSPNKIPTNVKQPQFCDSTYLDEGGAESESTLADKDAFLSSESVDDESDNSSVLWQENPLRTNQKTGDLQPKNQNIAHSVSFPDQTKFTVSGSRDVGSVLKRGETKSVESSGSGTRSADRSDFLKSTEDVTEDVEPYGMVDLSKLQPTFSEVQVDVSRAVSRSSEDELTPTSIMNSVNQFNETNSKSPTKSGKFSFEEAADMPNFPLRVDVNKKRATKARKTENIKHYRSKSDAEHKYDEAEQPGYDNLENYGGSAGDANDAKKKLREALLPAKYTQSPAPLHKTETPSRKTLAKEEGDSLSCEPGLSRQAPGSRASFPLPAAESRLSRHSSAVRAVDRHSGNLKRAKESGVLGSFAKSSSFRSAERHQKHAIHQATTLPRANTVDSDGNDKNDENNEKFKMQPRSLKQSTTNNSVSSLPKFGSQIPPNHHKSKGLHRVHRIPSDYDENQDEGVVNPYEEVPFMTKTNPQQQAVISPPETTEQIHAKSQVKEIMENIQPPESHYRPKPPVPRYPVDYDNFYLGKTDTTDLPKQETNEQSMSKPRNISGATSSSSPLSSPAPDDRSFAYSDATNTPASTPSLARASKSSRYKGGKTPQHPDEINEDETGHNASDSGSRSLGSQLRYLLGGGQDSKHVSPSIRRKRSLLKRSKSPGGSRRSNSPSKSTIPLSSNVSNEETDVVKTESGKSSDTESRDQTPPRRSASQRLVDRRGRSASQKVKNSEEQPELRRKDKSRMSSRWRRSKSQDRESPTRSKGKKIFGRRSKSQERPDEDFEAKDRDTGDEERGGRRFLRRSRSSSRKRDRRGRSSERSEDGNSSAGGRGRNPVSFFKRLLRSRKSDDEMQIVHSTFDKVSNGTDSTEALSTILAYKDDEETDKDGWNPPRPNPPQQRINKAKNKNKPSVAAKSNKVLKSPPSHRAKKFSSSLVANKNRSELSTGSSSEGIDKRRTDRMKMLDAHADSKCLLITPQRSLRPPSSKSSLSYSTPSSDCEALNRNQNKRKAREAHDDDLALKRVPLNAAALRRNFLNRDYDSDTATSVRASDAESSAGLHSDLDGNNPAALRSALKSNEGHQFLEKSNGLPKRPVRTIPLHRSQSDPSIFPGPSTPQKTDNTNTYYNMEDDASNQAPSTAQEKKRANKSAHHRRRNQKQTRRQTAPVDLAYEAHQRQKYKTLVSLNSQTLRKVTEKWLSEWRNQLPVGGFLITSWSDVALSSHRPMAMIANSVVYSAVSTGTKQFHLACQLYDKSDVDDRMVRKLDNCSSLPAHPNTCGVCSHFNCRVPRSLLDPSSGGGAADAVCVVLTTRPSQSLQDYLDAVACHQDPEEFHKHVLVNILQLLQGIKHLQSSGFDFPHVSCEHLIITEDRAFLQILPHLHYSEHKGRRLERMDSYQSSDSDSALHHSITQQVGHLMKNLLQNCNLAAAAMGRGAADRKSSASTTSAYVISGSKYSTAIKHIIRHFDTSPTLDVQEAAQIIQCALWGPDDLEDVGVDDVSPYAALELWIEMEQAKLVNSLAVLASTERLAPLSFLKHQYFATVTPQSLFNGLKVLQRI